MGYTDIVNIVTAVFTESNAYYIKQDVAQPITYYHVDSQQPFWLFMAFIFCLNLIMVHICHVWVVMEWCEVLNKHCLLFIVFLSNIHYTCLSLNTFHKNYFNHYLHSLHYLNMYQYHLHHSILLYLKSKVTVHIVNIRHVIEYGVWNEDLYIFVNVMSFYMWGITFPYAKIL